MAVSVSSGRESDSRVKRKLKFYGDVGRLLRRINNPARRGPQRVERANEVENPKGVR
jgi:hypothetical protein